MNQLEVTKDIFGGITVHPDCLPGDPDTFARLLEGSLTAWERQAFKQVWLTIPIEQSALIPVTVSVGFSFHHCSEGQITLVKRLTENAVIPPGATHLIGAGAVVLSERNELLVVLERYERRPGFYKLPGGLLNHSEHIADAVVREVLEETGIETSFDSLLCLTHLHQWQFGKSNIYLVCRLVPLTSKITVDEKEIAEAKWMPLDEYLSSEHVGAFNKQIVAATLNSPGLSPSTIAGFEIERSRFEAYFPRYCGRRKSPTHEEKTAIAPATRKA